MDTKRCTRCGESKPLDQFYRHRTARKDGLHTSCKACMNVAQMRWRRDNAEYVRQYQAQQKQRRRAELRLQRQEATP